MFETFKIGFGETQWLVMTALGLYTWFINKQSASAKEMLDIRLRVTELESAVKDMPSKLEIETVKTQLNSANSNIEKVHGGVKRIEDWLIEKKM